MVENLSTYPPENLGDYICAEDFGRLEGLLSLAKLKGFYAAAVFLSDKNRFEDAVLPCTHKS